MYDQCHEQGLGRMSRRCFLSAAAGVAGFALAGPARAECLVRPSEGRDSADVQSQSGTDPSPLTISCPDCCRVLAAYRSHT